MMPAGRFVVVGLAHAHAGWFGDVSRWATSAALPIEFIKCLSIEELRARLASARPLSAVLIDGSVPGLDRDVVDVARRRGGAVLIVADRRVERDWRSLGAAAVLPCELERADLLDALETHTSRIAHGDRLDLIEPPRPPTPECWRGRLIAVTGPGGTGASVLAMALAESLAADGGEGGMVLLADLALDADQALLHDAGDVMPGVPELVDAHRLARPSFDEIRALTFSVPDRGYHLLLGLRRHREWAEIRPRAFEAALAGLRLAFRAVVADVDSDVEGQDQCGSVDVEERNAMARITAAQADAVVVVGTPGPKGVARLVRTLWALVEHHVAIERLVPVVNRAPRSPRARAELTATVPALAGSLTTAAMALAPPVFVGERRRLDEAIRDAARLPRAAGDVLRGAVDAAIRRAAAVTPASPASEPFPVTPGSLGAWSS